MSLSFVLNHSLALKILSAQEAWYVFKQCKHNSILRTVESTLKPNQTTQEHNTKSHPATKPAIRREFLSPLCSFAPSLQFCSFLANKKRLSRYRSSPIKHYGWGTAVCKVPF